jgi:hypothetical protein
MRQFREGVSVETSGGCLKAVVQLVALGRTVAFHGLLAVPSSGAAFYQLLDRWLRATQQNFYKK